jgi:fumarylacetoacetate (FAA) hydrolase
MKLATLKNGSRDGQLVVVSRDLSRAVSATEVAGTLQQAIEHWSAASPTLAALYEQLNAGSASDTFAFDPHTAMAPLPRAYQWCDGSAFRNHGLLMERAFQIDPPPDADTIPLMYQGGSDDFLGPRDDVPLPSEAHGIDFEGEYAVVVDDVPMGCTPELAIDHVKLLLIANDWSLRSFGPREMKTGFGFFQAKPASSFAPIAVTPDELGNAWHKGRVHLSLHIHWNSQWFGSPNGREMSFSFFELISHAAKTRRLRAGTIIGSGTVSNVNRSAGSACIAERRVIEMLDQGQPSTGFLHFGDSVRLEVLDDQGQSIFGAIDQRVVRATQPANV